MRTSPDRTSRWLLPLSALAAFAAAGLALPACGPTQTECIPTTCEAEGKNCGFVESGCRDVEPLFCGVCSAPNTCGEGGVANVCGCVPETDADLCNVLVGQNSCGTVTGADKCETERTVNCGVCAGIDLCGGGGDPNICANPTANALLGVAVVAPDNIWAVGELGTIVHFDGTVWTTRQSGTQQLNGIWVKPDGTDGWIVGNGGTLLRLQSGTWSAVTPPSGVGTTHLNAVHGRDSHVWIAGHSGTLLHDDGTGFAVVDSGSTQNLFAVFAEEDGTASAGGATRTLVTSDGAGGYTEHTLPSATVGLSYSVRTLWRVNASSPLLFGGTLGFGAWDDATVSIARFDPTTGARGLWQIGTANGFGVGERNTEGQHQYFRFAADGTLAPPNKTVGAALNAVSGAGTTVWGAGQLTDATSTVGAIIQLQP